jgi:hypothetical protein
MDNHPSICQIGQYRWTAIRLNSLQGDIGGCCPSTYSYLAARSVNVRNTYVRGWK